MFTTFYDAAMADPSIAPYVDPFLDFVEPLGLFFGILLVALTFVLGFFGQRMFGFLRWTIVFADGFILGAGLLAPILKTVAPAISGLMVGLAVGLILAALSRFIYNMVFVGVIGFDVFNICFNALLIPALAGITKGNVAFSLGAALIIVIVALVFRKYFEMVLTAAVGGIGLAFALKAFIFNYTVLLPLAPATTALILGAIVAVVMLVYQFKTRIRF